MTHSRHDDQPAELIGALAEAPELYYTLGGGQRGRVIVTLHRKP